MIDIQLRDTMPKEEIEKNLQLLREVANPTNEEEEQILNEFVNTLRAALIDKNPHAQQAVIDYMNVIRKNKQEKKRGKQC